MTEANDNELPIDVQEIISEFESEIGRLHGQLIVSRKVAEARAKKNDEEKSVLLKSIGDLTSRLEMLESSAPVIVNDPPNAKPDKTK